MNLYPFASLSKSTREAVWPVIVGQGGFIPRFCYNLPSTFTHTRQTQAYEWSKANNVNMFLSVVLQVVIFDNEDDAAIFKLTWM